ncbi:MAG TPA: hypothetical protein VND44_04885 [Acidimicrobiales bacterium]|nr:hypothetical protein [Acidimicrobiales bacterium]
MAKPQLTVGLISFPVAAGTGRGAAGNAGQAVEFTNVGETNAVVVGIPTSGVFGAEGFPGCRPISVNPVVPGATGRMP